MSDFSRKFEPKASIRELLRRADVARVTQLQDKVAENLLKQSNNGMRTQHLDYGQAYLDADKMDYTDVEGKQSQPASPLDRLEALGVLEESDDIYDDYDRQRLLYKMKQMGVLPDERGFDAQPDSIYTTNDVRKPPSMRRNRKAL